MQINSTDLSAKLLATENINVVRARARTASFDIKSRTLTLPQWKDMTPEIESMLVGHEVGHALYTEAESYMKPMETNRSIHSYLNVIEDVRIEKLIKRKYPGIRKTMNEGYKQLNDRDFFGIKSIQNFESLILIDKINLYFKAGFACGVKFTPEEKAFVVRAEKTETVEDVVALAQDIYEFSKSEMQERKQRMNQIDPADLDDLDEIEYDGDFDEDPIFADDDFDEEETQERENGARRATKEKHDPSEVTDEELQSKTERVFTQKLEELADESTEYRFYDFVKNYAVDPIISYKTILKESAGVDADLEQSHLDMVAQFKQDTTRSVNYLVKEFEMRKSAQMYKRAQVSKSGSLNMGKVYAYQLSDDIFKRITTIPEGKNHGMIFLLDWSGSMDTVLQDTLKQVINLAMFCQRAQIPYQVLAFSTQYAFTDEQMSAANSARRATHQAEENLIDNYAGMFSLLELFSSKMSTSEFNVMVRRTLSWHFQRCDKHQFSTGGTPLNEALMYMLNVHMSKFIKNNSVEKMTLITLTDGEGGSLSTNKGSFRNKYTEYTHTGGYRYVNVKHFLRDTLTKKNYNVTDNSATHTAALLKMIKERFSINVLGFYICENHRNTLRGALQNNIPDFNGDVYATIDNMRKEFRDVGYASLKNTGRDELYIVPVASTKIEEGEMSANADMSAAAIAKKFSKFMNNKKTSRVLLNNFIGYVA